jgi:uncharacterized SAM-binding protein YcdF (DUF218 family)
VLDIALVGDGTKIRATMIQVSSGGRPDSSGRRQTLATDALLGILAVFIVAELTPFRGYELAGTILSVLVGAAGGAAIGQLFRRRVLITIDALLIVAYLVVAGTPIVAPFTTRWIRNDPLPPDTLDAVVVLSASVLSDSALSANAADRLLSGLELMRDGRARRIITTRQVEPNPHGEITSDGDQRRLISLASIAADRWTIVPGAKTTHDEALLTSRLLIPAGEKRIIVVTSPMHTRRACAVFEAVGFTVVCRAARERDGVTNPPSGTHDRLAALRSYGYELVGFAKYRAMGWLTPRPVVTQGTGGSS